MSWTLSAALLGCQSLVSLFSNGQADALSTGQGDPWLVAFAYNEDVGEPGGKAVAIGVLHMNHVKRPGVPLPVGDHPNSAQVGTASHHAQVTCVKLDEVCDLACLQVNLDRIIHLDEGVWIADSAGIMSDQVRDSFGAHKDLPHLAQLVLGLLRCDAVHSKPALGIIHQAEMLTCLLNADDI